MTDRLQRFERVVGQLKEVSPDAWQWMIVYEQAEALTVCAVAGFSFIGAVIGGVLINRIVISGKGESAVTIGIFWLIGIIFLFFGAWNTLPANVATAIAPEASLINGMLE